MGNELDEEEVQNMATRSNESDSTTPVVDTADTSARAPEPDLSGKRVRAIPYQNGNVIIVDKSDFANAEIDHPKVTFDQRVDRFTLPVGKQLSKEAADFLTSKYPETFEYIND